MNSVDSTFNGHILTYFDNPFYYNDFSIVLRGYGQLDHGESKKHGFETPGCNLRALGPKNHENGQNFKVIFRDFLLSLNQIDHEESENRGPETLGSILRAPEHP